MDRQTHTQSERKKPRNAKHGRDLIMKKNILIAPAINETNQFNLKIEQNLILNN